MKKDRNTSVCHKPEAKSLKHILPLALLLGYLCTTPSIQAGWFWLNPKPTGSTLNGVSFVDTLTGYVAGYGGTIMKTTDGGANWNFLTTGTSRTLYSVHFPFNAQTGYAVGDSGLILKTIDGGTTWVSQYSRTTFPLRSVHFPADVQTGYAVGTGGIILKTTDGGANWIILILVSDYLYSVHFPVDAQTGYVAGYYWSGQQQRTILKTTDGGSTWARQSAGSGSGLYSVHFPTDNQTGYAVGDNGTILKTVDGGTNWYSQNAGTNHYLYSVNFPVNTQTGYIVGYYYSPQQSTILKTTDGGKHLAQTKLEHDHVPLFGEFSGGCSDRVCRGGPGLALEDHGWRVQLDQPEQYRHHENALLGAFPSG